MCAFCSSTILEAWNGAFLVSTRAKVTKEPSFQAFLGTDAMIPLQVLVICSQPVSHFSYILPAAKEKLLILCRNVVAI